MRRVLVDYLDGEDDFFIVHNQAKFEPDGMALHIIDPQNTGVTRTYPIRCTINLRTAKRVLVIDNGD
jgi:hypothetical protein